MSSWSPPHPCTIQPDIQPTLDLGDHIIARVAARLARAEILQEPGRQFTFVLTTGALGWRVGSPDVMTRQVEHIAELSQRPHVRVGVIPWGVEATVFPPCGFDLYDEHTVVVGVIGGSAYYNDPPDVARYVAMLAALEHLAVFGSRLRPRLSATSTMLRTSWHTWWIGCAS